MIEEEEREGVTDWLREQERLINTQHSVIAQE
jgi:hypothetical protein